MKSIVLIAAAPLALSACNFGVPGGNTANARSASNATAAVPDSVVVNGVTYVRAGADRIAPATMPTPAPAATAASAPVSDTGASVPTNTDTAGASADHGN